VVAGEGRGTTDTEIEKKVNIETKKNKKATTKQKSQKVEVPV
jgi:hypothetical protein